MRAARGLTVGMGLGLFLFAALWCGETSNDETGFEPLMRSGGMADFDRIGGSPETWRIVGDVIECSGTPNGYFATRKVYGNFVLRFEFRYVRPDDLTDEAAFRGNSGYLLHIAGEPKVWPRCIEVQGRNSDVGKIFALGGAPGVVASEKLEAREEARRPVGEWNRLEITSRDGEITARLNGVVVCTAKAGGDLPAGPIGFQSEGAGIHFRNLRIKELP